MANKNKEGFEWPVIVKNANARSSLDYFYGPYDSVDDLDKDDVLPKNLKFPGFTAAVYETVNGKKTLVEYWWTGNGWERKGVPVSTYVTFKGVVETLPNSANVGDLYILKKSNGEDNEEYIWTESGKFELLGKLKAETNGSLNLEGDSFTIDGTSKTTYSFNGTQSVTLHLGKYLTEDEAANIYLKQTDAANTYLTNTDASSTYLTKDSASNTYLTKSDAKSTYQQKGDYITKTDAANTYLTKTDASSTYLTKTDAKITYQPKGNYLTKSQADNTYQAKGDYLTKTEASSTYLSKTDASNTYLTQENAESTYAKKDDLFTMNYIFNSLTHNSAFKYYIQETAREALMGALAIIDSSTGKVKRLSTNTSGNPDFIDAGMTLKDGIITAKQFEEE